MHFIIFGVPKALLGAFRGKKPSRVDFSGRLAGHDYAAIRQAGWVKRLTENH
jgi:hypothetical protein